MTAEREGLAELLAEHEYRFSGKGSICLCGFVPTVIADTLQSQQDYHRHHLADLLAARDRRVRGEAAVDFAQWVATNRAHNGSDHRYGQSLYNECINAALPTWAVEWIEAP